MQTADSNENLRQDFAYTVVAATDIGPDPDGGSEQNENHLNNKYQQLSWRSNGFQRNKEQLQSAVDERNQSASAGNWRVLNNKDNHYQHQHSDSASEDMIFVQQDKKFSTRTFEQSCVITDVDVGNVESDMLHAEKGLLRNSSHSIRDLSGIGRSNQRLQTSNDKSKVTHLAHLLLSEDMRISKILRRLLNENSSASAVDLCKKLEQAVRTPENVLYICRSFEYLTESMITVLKQCPVQCAEQASSILGVIGYINRADFPIYKNYISKTYQTCKGIQKYLMMALKTTFSCDAVNLNLAVYSDRVLVLLKDYLENADKAENFIAVSETIAEFSKHYKRAFQKHFTDIVDIIVGWHLEMEQPQALKLHCSTVLQQLSQYFVQELDFTFGLLGQFLEDIASFGEKAELSVGSFVGAFNSILKSLATQQEFIAFSMGRITMQQAVIIITRATKQCLSLMLCEETILNFNEFFCLIFANDFDAVDIAEIVEIVALEIKQFNNMNEQQVASLLVLMLSIIRQLRTCTPIPLVTLILNSADNPLTNLKFSCNEKNFKLLLKIYHEILMLKNVPLLQEAYRHIVYDVDSCMSVLQSREFYGWKLSTAQAECILNFYLAALSALATQTSSIIGMYALNPSISELLIGHCQAANVQFWSKHGTLHSALLQLIAVHCEKNHNYRISSLLLRDSQHTLDDASSNSPTSQNFSLILKFLSEVFNESAAMAKYNLRILLHWTGNLLKECLEHAFVLEEHPHFLGICKAVCTAALEDPLECAPCLQILLTYSVINRETLLCLREASVFLIDSVNPEISEMYTTIFAKLPLSISLDFSKSADTVPISQRKSQIQDLAQWYTSTSHSAPLRDKYFKPFLEKVSFPKQSSSSPSDVKNALTSVTEFAQPIFTRCWVALQRENAVAYQQAACSSSHLLNAWLQHEAACYCVRNKLRTTVGKPQETFLRIEAIIMQYARILAMKEDLKGEVASLEGLALVQSLARQLLGFLECLEKHIYNAAEGTAFALPPLEKPAKTFFRVNAPTCNEWFKRIRTAVDLVAIHSMEPAMVIRYSEVILKSLCKSAKYNELLMDHTIMSLVWALLHCRESDTLQGLYSWVKEKTGKRYLWIKYVAEQAAGHKEQAAEGYLYLLSEHDSRMDAYIKEFLTDQLLDCLYFTNQWSQLREVLRGTETMKRETIALSCTQNVAVLNAMEDLYFGFAQPSKIGQLSNSLHELMEWKDCAEADNAENTNFSYYKTLQRLESSCLISSIQAENSDKWRMGAPLSAGAKRALHKGLQECLQQHNTTVTLHASEHLTDFIILNHVAQKQIDGLVNSEVAAANTFECSQVMPQSTVLLKCQRWSRIFEIQSNSNQLHRNNYSMLLDVAASARREGNAKLCASELGRFFALKGLREPLVDISSKVQNKSLIVDISDAVLLRGYSELAKYLYANNSSQFQLDAINLASAYCSQLIDQVSVTPEIHYPATSAKMFLTLSEWLLQRGSTAVTSSNSPQLQHLLSHIPNITDPHLDVNIGEIIPTYDMAIGKLIQTSIHQNDTAGQAWCAFGNWCYRWGKKLVEFKTDGKSTHKAGLSQRDLDQIKESLEEVDNIENVMDDIIGILNRHQVNPNDGDEDIETSEISSTELIESQLRKINALRGKPAMFFSSIIKTWRQAHKNIYTYYEMAAEAYFKYLCIETAGKGAKQGACTEDSTLVTTTLRLLRLVVKHAFGLQEVLEEGLSNTPTRPWKVIIPQLFSRLNHHEPYVRKRVSELLCRVAEDKPHLIIFPAVVGAQQELKRVQMPDFTGGKDIESSSLRDNDERTTPLSNCFNALLFTLSKQAPETVKQVQLLVKELKRVTLLWDEYWIHCLAQLYAEYSSLFSALEVETKKATDLNLDSLRTKHAILMRYVIADLRKIAAVSEKPAETNYERNFQERYNAFIRNTIHELEQPLNVHKTNESWQRIKHLYSVFQQRALRASASSLKMNDISPILANMRNTGISMPGVETIDRQPVYIKAVDNTVYILPTKTKPKKLAFLGSDGRKYTYLFKGFEDLHLDERIMQFLSISNSMMARSVDSVNSSNSYKAQHYSVIPLGPQSGLISWVDGVTPLFAIYKKAQQREALAKQQQKERPVNSNQVGQHSTSVPPAAVRPSELFYSKLTPLLAEQNIKVTDTRKHWPLSTLRRVLEELTRETPRDLLAKELWCHATNAADWRRSVRNYSLSVAVMSVIGYVIGLGDRHLDNVLVKLSTGEIVHIDYNVCFEKGKTLRVPEKVPFRMTPNLEEALGITGIEGTFRLGCEHVLKILRKERETLLTLLEAFVYDPLVDWAVGDDGTTTSTHMTNALAAAADISVLKLTTASGVPGDAEEGHKRLRQDHLLQRKNIDAEITRNTISLRFNELKPFWVQYKDEATFKLQEIVSHVQELEQTRQDIQRAEQERDSLTKQLAMIRELEMLGSAMGSHPLNTISQRYAVYKKSAEEFNRIKQGVKKCYNELQASAEIYFERLINTAPNTELAQLRNQLCEHQQSACANEFELVRELLEQSAQDQLYHKSDFARREMDNTVYQQARVAMECVDSLLQYARIMRFYPRSQLARHRIVQYMQWYSDLLDEVGEGRVLDAELQRFVEDELLVDPGEQLKTLQYSSAMEKLWIELNIDLHKSVNFLGEQQQQVIVPVDAALKSIESFISIDNVKHTRALQLAMLETIAKTNESFIVFEESSLNQNEDDTFILDQQIDYIDMLLTMLHAVFVDIPPPAQSYTTIKTLDACLQALYKLKSAFHVDMPERIAALFTLDDDVDLKSCLDMLCSSSGGLENYKRAISNVSNVELQDLLVEIEELFDECGIRLNNLSEIVQDILNQTPDGRVKQFVLSIYCYDFDPSNEKYETISKVFHTVRTHVASLQTKNLRLLYDVRLLNAPVVEFLNSMQQCFLTGLTSLIASALEHSLHKTLATIEISKQTDPEEASALLNAKTLCQNLFLALQQNCTLKHVQLQVHEKTKLVEHFTLVATAHFWANERYLRDSKPLYGHVVHKEKVLNSVQNASQSLGVWKLTMSKIQTEIEENVAAIAQRLKWAVGANQNLNSLQESFHSCVQTQNSRYRFFMNAALQLIECSNVLLQFELMQGNHDGSTVEADRAFSATVTKWQNSLDAFRQMGSMITPVEQSIVQLLDPEGKVDQCWINNISGLLDEMTFAVQRQLVEFERTAQKIQENIYEGGQQLQSLMDNQLRMDMRHLLKSVLKVNSLSNQVNLERSNSLISARIREFQHTHKQFYAQLNDLQMKIISRDFAEHMLHQLKEQILHILQIMEDNYEDLFDLVQSFIQNDFSNSSPARSVRSAAQSQNNANTNATSLEKKAINQREQKRNAYAVSVWKRIRMKLEGRDPDPNRRCTVPEQIDFIIREATNPDNLAVLYEGWTPWV